MNIEDFLQFCKEQEYTAQARALFRQAIQLAENYLGKKKRLAGDTFFIHNLRVGKILAESKSEPSVVVAGLLHGICTFVPIEKLKQQFDEEIVTLIQQDEIKHIKSANNQVAAEALRKILLTTLKDVRVIFVKLAVKLDNLRTIEPLPEDEQKRIAQEILDVYAPLAYRLGLEKVRTALEDLSLRILHPRKYHEIANFFEASKEERQETIHEIVKKINTFAEGNLKIINIKGRPKHIYSIYKNITTKKGRRLTDFHDLLGIRVIVSSIKDCYVLLGLLHETFKPIQGRLKDYIATPKENFYRSLHTGIELSDGKKVEIQIRTQEMDEFAEEGLAAHWRYKNLKSDQIFEKKISWLRNILELQKEGKHKEFLQAAEVDIFGDKIYCYTPKGDVKELPKNATLLDFAFTVHEEVGNKAVGGRVNGKFVPLKAKLVVGDIVEIITNKRQRPRRGWLKIVRSSRARQKIRKSLKQYETIAPLHYRLWKPTVKDEQAALVGSEAFPKAACILAKCCSPLPDEKIVGILTKRRVVSVHKEDCRLAQKETERWVPVHWKETFSQKIKFHVQAKERSGLLAELLHTIAQVGFEVKEAKVKFIDAGNAQCSFLVVPRDLTLVKKMVERLKNVRGVVKLIFE
ncbi:bifunctional (p)ppGpp synthetase/guanosine-3',5'-bis(diphosphate) 3'-pyrophosphohydrolase [Candidatus Woesearchaeota archaeon]|jgi:GTP diphosphokinase / guanosine-3',5'-bis(diphosphate) 3'-diphosphatase|nr:bifunctional (p)ppGpp synthetase/guanosine-3',5'-bis(diphosphate) 3'-pyrophosphohydrolase [Candidatus Woesearchaeota archaeon]